MYIKLTGTLKIGITFYEIINKFGIFHSQKACTCVTVKVKIMNITFNLLKACYIFGILNTTTINLENKYLEQEKSQKMCMS